MSTQTAYRMADALGITLKFRNDRTITGEGKAKINFGMGTVDTAVKVLDGFYESERAVTVSSIGGDLLLLVFVTITPSPKTTLMLLDAKDDKEGYMYLTSDMSECSMKEVARLVEGRQKATFEGTAGVWKKVA